MLFPIDLTARSFSREQFFPIPPYSNSNASLKVLSSEMDQDIAASAKVLSKFRPLDIL